MSKQKAMGSHLGALRKASAVNVAEIAEVSGMSTAYIYKLIKNDLPLPERFLNIVFPFLVKRYMRRVKENSQLVLSALEPFKDDLRGEAWEEVGRIAKSGINKRREASKGD